MYWTEKTIEEKYLRFRTGLRWAGTSSLLGVFSAVADLEDSDALDVWSEQRVSKTCEWFNRHLPVPVLEREHHRALFWFRENCRDMVRRLWDVVYVLRDHGIHVELVHTTDPGHFCYRDRYQIAAIPRRRRR